jgi:hypothetical protein
VRQTIVEFITNGVASDIAYCFMINNTQLQGPNNMELTDARAVL